MRESCTYGSVRGALSNERPYRNHSMQRREFITLLGGAAAASSVSWPLVAHAQQGGAMRRIGILMTYAETDPLAQAYLAAFRDGLQKLGWVDGRNVRIDIRWSMVDVEWIQRFAGELIAPTPDLILTPNTPSTAAVLKQTRTIPLLFVNVADPVGSGFVASLPRPGGNVTGFIGMEGALAGKWLELLREIAPRVVRVACLFNPTTAPYEYYLKPIIAAAASIGVEANAAPVRNSSELESVIAAQTREPNGGLIVMPDGFTNVYRAEITSLAARYRIPAVYAYRFFPEVGGLLSYGNDQVDNYRRAAVYADRILKGIKPSELPVQVPVKFEMVVNVKTAKALGLEVPSSFYWRADEVIE
jgi:putative tryptophan/tyrosine transport system substrate-binding protein